MGLIIKSFMLSFAVTGRMILPTLVILLLATVLGSVLNAVTGGYASAFTDPLVAGLVTLVGIGAALSVLGDNRRPDYGPLIVYAALYAAILFVAKAAAVLISDVSAVLYAGVQLGDAVSLRNLADAEWSLKLAFGIHALGAKAVILLVLYTSVFAVMAVPMANAARAAASGGSVGIFHGFGRGFVPLFCIFLVSFFLQFFFGLFTIIFALFPLLIGVVSFVISQTLPDFDVEVIAKGVAAGLGLLWLHAWTWSASALALVQSDAAAPAPKATPQSTPKATDLRALRKSRL